ncbi:uncharacterized protein N7459_009242 [Penicillium hispanicum]|uniref:uncharacterized protein n=1 Tax=Penicillium hispanicum TaxID=1080232 RepID=UPI0025406605|nr:uncharacterized protein N7459_009242 [Penicillium hispanicum]KAJ5569812.1 hypothetical protein N7459_009242 [Penicillium hispanicum]
MGATPQKQKRKSVPKWNPELGGNPIHPFVPFTRLDHFHSMGFGADSPFLGDLEHRTIPPGMSTHTQSSTTTPSCKPALAHTLTPSPGTDGQRI